ncbi:AzlD domain-containing protein [Chachezhania sediminis]|uniref:AzlD domain-containing protein n=1 Tax=Chachezhania sediminis TaxID=2599291 RepID=UPI00131BA248|nr:AzlD domain-containing protein [Chachezhania sediminis]
MPEETVVVVERAFTDAQFWIICAGLAVGSFALRFGFLALMGGRTMPEAVLRHLRYTAVAILPALVTPLVIWPAATDGVFSLPHLAAGAMTVIAGYVTRSALGGILGGIVTLYLVQYL